MQTLVKLTDMVVEASTIQEQEYKAVRITRACMEEVRDFSEKGKVPQQ